MPSKQEKQIDDALKRIEKKITEAKIKAINVIAQEVQQQSIDLVAQNIGIDRNLISDRGVRAKIASIRLIKAIKRNPKASIKVSGKRLPLIDQGGQWRKSNSGASYIGRGGVRTVVPGSFIATMPTGHSGIYKRKTKKHLPIKELFGTSVPKVFSQVVIQTQLINHIRNNLPSEMRRQMRK